MTVPETKPATKLRVLSYNIHSSKDDLRALATVVREIAPDVMIIQEAPRRFRWRQKCADLAALVRPGGGRGRTAVAG